MTAFENIVGKEGIASNDAMFSTQSEKCISICQYF